MCSFRVQQSIDMLQTSDLILMILDATKRAEQRALIEAELEAVGIRLNREPPCNTLDRKKRIWGSITNLLY